MVRPSCFKGLLAMTVGVGVFSACAGAQVGRCTAANCWKYAGQTGPDAWAGLTPYAYCEQKNNPTQQQSPIDLLAGKPTRPNPGMQVEVHYGALPVMVEDMGYTIEANYGKGSDENTVTFGGKTYKLIQFHFHEPNEHAMGTGGDGTTPKMEVHLVHQAGDGSLLVVGALIVVPARGGENAGFAKVMEGLASHKPVEINPVEMIPGKQNTKALKFYTYAGSLTTPPCTPGPTWIVLRDPITISAEQLAWYKYKDSARPRLDWIEGLKVTANFMPGQ